MAAVVIQADIMRPQTKVMKVRKERRDWIGEMLRRNN